MRGRRDVKTSFLNVLKRDKIVHELNEKKKKKREENKFLVNKNMRTEIKVSMEGLEE